MNKEKYMKNGVFSLEYDKETLKDMVLELQEQLEAYENMRKEAIEIIEDNWITYEDSKTFTEFNEELPVFIKEINNLLNILNKVGEDNENNN